MQAEALIGNGGLALAGPLLLTPRLFGDDRGFFFESWNQRTFERLAGPGAFVQDNQSRSAKGVLRGLHYQLPPKPQGKLVRCVVGEIFDVVVDLRRSSPTFRHWVGTRLNAVTHQQLWVPPGFAHGFLTLSDQAEVLYKTSDYWSKECERAIRWDDPELAIAWPLAVLGGTTLQLSEKDGDAPLLAALAPGELFP